MSTLINPHTVEYIQSRAEMNYALVDEYAAQMQDGVNFDPVQCERSTDGESTSESGRLA